MIGKRKYIRMMSQKGKSSKELAACYGKIRHATYEDAKLAASRKPHVVKPYKCQFGKHYHIGRRS